MGGLYSTGGGKLMRCHRNGSPLDATAARSGGSPPVPSGRLHDAATARAFRRSVQTARYPLPPYTRTPAMDAASKKVAA